MYDEQTLFPVHKTAELHLEAEGRVVLRDHVDASAEFCWIYHSMSCVAIAMQKLEGIPEWSWISHSLGLHTVSTLL